MINKDLKKLQISLRNLMDLKKKIISRKDSRVELGYKSRDNRLKQELSYTLRTTNSTIERVIAFPRIPFYNAYHRILKVAGH